MGSRELRRLIEDNEAWLTCPENQRQARIVHRLRSSENHQRRHSTNHGQESVSNAIIERRRQTRAPPQHRRQDRAPAQHRRQARTPPQHRRQARTPSQHRRQDRAPPQHRRQETSSERSRSPLRHVPMESPESSRATGESPESSRATGDSSCDNSLGNTNAFTFQPPCSSPQSRTPSRLVPAPGRTMGESSRGDGSQVSGSPTAEFILFSPPYRIPLNRRLRNISSPDTTPRESGSNNHQFEFRPPNPVPYSGILRQFTAVNYHRYMFLQMHGIDVMRQTMQEMQPPTPPAENLAFQETWQPQPYRRTLQSDTFQTRKMSPQEDTGSCVICLTEFEIGENITELQCKHIFHQSCIVTWLQSNPSCPLCRKTAC
ncbi:uncharacterized protein ACNLHF_011778 [Anomaloglossus baeobatrachus]|uniref:uncharacterized protein LOC142295299 n=1 Tax=Anomaloglossus baeobatrachus TaxID=238106 RepID=UPI003F4F9AAF